MLSDGPKNNRDLRCVSVQSDLVVVGGGLAGVCCAVTAARAGVKVVLVQDRPVLGGNSSSEVRLWVLGATSHMGNNNRWAREGGLVDEILVENLFRNREGNALIFDTILLEKVAQEPNITLLLNTAVYEAEKADPDAIRCVRAFCSLNSTRYELRAPLFCDASGDGVVGFLAGAAFRMGAEPREEFGEKFAPDAEYGQLLGHSIYFLSKDTGQPVKFVPPSFALQDVPAAIPRYHVINAHDSGCRLWWIEYGGRLDTVHDSQAITWELWKIVYGIWNYIKNSGKFPEAETMTLEWVGAIPGKRESRRFEGEYILRQQDIIEQREHRDAVSFGGWSIDLHPADGVYSEKPGCNQWHSKGVYQIPYRCMYSRNIRNLFLAGRIISASHVAFASTRVMATCGHGGQAVGVAAAICLENHLLPRDLSAGRRIESLQRELARRGQYIPRLTVRDPRDAAPRATVSASSELALALLPDGGPLLGLKNAWAMMLPAGPGRLPKMGFTADVSQDTRLTVELRVSSKAFNHTPDVTLESRGIQLSAGEGQPVEVQFDAVLDQPRYVFVCLRANEAVSMHTSPMRLTGVLSLCHMYNPAVAKGAVQAPREDIGVESFEFWCPQRRPGGRNLAMTFDPPLKPFAAANVVNGVARPTFQTNAWAADLNDPAPQLTLAWDKPEKIQRIELSFDTDFDHPAESVLLGHPENVMPFCVRRYRVLADGKEVLARCDENHQTRNAIVLDKPVTVRRLSIEVSHPSQCTPAALLEVRCYAQAGDTVGPIG